eukprot:4466381-Amphidinium_carterae.1
MGGVRAADTFGVVGAAIVIGTLGGGGGIIIADFTGGGGGGGGATLGRQGTLSYVGLPTSCSCTDWRSTFHGALVIFLFLVFLSGLSSNPKRVHDDVWLCGETRLARLSYSAI